MIPNPLQAPSSAFVLRNSAAGEHCRLFGAPTGLKAGMIKFESERNSYPRDAQRLCMIVIRRSLEILPDCDAH